MNAKKILDQLMKQASGSQSHSGSHGSGGFDVNKIVGGLASKLGGEKVSGQSSGKHNQASSSGGLDVKSLLGSGALGMLFGSKRGRRSSGSAVKYSALASIGALAWKAYQDHQASSQSSTQAQQGSAAEQGIPLEQLQGHAQEQRGLEILQAMIMAARADGHIDADERAQLTREIESLGADEELNAWVQAQFQAPLDAEALAREADSPQAAREIYLVSLAMIDDQNAMERAWLDQLANALKLEPALVAELERQIQTQA